MKKSVFILLVSLLSIGCKEDIRIFNVSTKVVASKPEIKDKITCDSKDSIVADSEDPIIIKTCYFGKYKSKTIGAADYKGRYSYGYQVFLKGNSGYSIIDNHLIFNDKQDELLAILNKQIEAEYNDAKNDKNTYECFAYKGEFKKFKMDDFGIEFNEDGMEFNCSFGLSGACFSQDGTSVNFKLSELEKYLAK